MDEMIAENNRLIRDLMFAKKAIKSLENITTFAIELTQEVDCDCKLSTVQRIRADIQTHLTSYESFKQQITADDSTRKTSMAMTDDNAITDLISDQDVKPKTTEITRVCHHCQQIIYNDCTDQIAEDTSYESFINDSMLKTRIKAKDRSKKSMANTKTVEGYCLMTALPMPLKCFGCDHLFTKCEDFLNHINRGNVTKSYVNKSTETTENSENKTPIDRKSPKIPIYPCVEGYRCGYKGCKYTTTNRKHVVFHFTAHKTYRPYRCTANGCRQWFKTDAHLRSHQIVVHPEEFPHKKWFTCSVTDCQYKTKVHSSLTKHMRSHTDTGVRYQCDECGKSYARQRTLDEHRSVVHTGVVEYRCQHCDKTYNCLSALKTHVKQTHYKVFVCDFNGCDKQFVAEMELRAHVLLVHDSGLESNVDEVMEQTFDDSSAQYSPTQQLFDPKTTDIPIYPCGEGYRCGYEGCTYIAKRERLIAKHSVVHRSDRPFRCRLNDCNQRFKTEALLNSHQINVHPEEFPDRLWLTCPTPGCEYRTKGNSNITKHIRTHTHRYGCDECDKTYATKLSLMDHKRSVHPGPDGTVKVYGCEMCDKTYPILRKLRAHIQQSHNRVFVCDFQGCDKQFGVQSHLLLHRQRVHDKSYVRPVACIWKGCEQRFDCNSKMKEHLNKHTGAKPFDCKHCDQQFATTGDRSAHMSNQHKDRPFACEWPDCQYRAAFMSRLRTHMKKHRIK